MAAGVHALRKVSVQEVIVFIYKTIHAVLHLGKEKMTKGTFTEGNNKFFLLGRTIASLKADLHDTTLSHATCLRQVYDTSCFV